MPYLYFTVFIFCDLAHFHRCNYISPFSASGEICSFFCCDRHRIDTGFCCLISAHFIIILWNFQISCRHFWDFLFLLLSGIFQCICQFYICICDWFCRNLDMQNFQTDQIIMIAVTCDFIRYIIGSYMYCGRDFFCPLAIAQFVEQSATLCRTGRDQFLFFSVIHQICFCLRHASQFKICFPNDKSNGCLCRKLIICIINRSCLGCISACLRLSSGYCNITGITFCQTFCGCCR